MNNLSDFPVTFHLSVNVSDIDRSVEFFSKVFGVAPAKHRKDYAKFELQNPPLTFSLEPVNPAERGVLNHVGFKFQSPAELVEVQRRLEMAGIRSEREEGVECCYSRQTKFWLHDPDGTLWEMYVLEGDIEHRGGGQEAEAVMGQPPAVLPQISLLSEVKATPEPKQQWSHRLGSPLTIPPAHLKGTLDEVSLQGTFNAAGTESQVGVFLCEVADRLKPGGTVLLHCLSADRHVDQLPALPGPASVVKAVPCLNSLMDDLEAAGFESIRLTKYGSRACFTAGEAELRETKIEATKPVAPTDELVAVIYRGPFPQVTLDSGTTLLRGRRTELNRTLVEQIKSTPVGELLVVLETATSAVSCTG